MKFPRFFILIGLLRDKNTLTRHARSCDYSALALAGFID